MVTESNRNETTKANENKKRYIKRERKENKIKENHQMERNVLRREKEVVNVNMLFF